MNEHGGDLLVYCVGVLAPDSGIIVYWQKSIDNLHNVFYVCLHMAGYLGQSPLHQFPRSKSVTSWRGQQSLVSAVWCRFPNSITTTYCQQVDNKLTTSPFTDKLRGNVSNEFWAYSSW